MEAGAGRETRLAHLLADERGGLSAYWILLSLVMFFIIGFIATAGLGIVVRQSLADQAWSAARYAAAEIDETATYLCAGDPADPCAPVLDEPAARQAAEAYVEALGFSLDGSTRRRAQVGISDNLVLVKLEADYVRILLPGGPATAAVSVVHGASPERVRDSS